MMLALKCWAYTNKLLHELIILQKILNVLKANIYFVAVSSLASFCAKSFVRI